MSFEEVLDQAITMLQRRGRLTYRTFKRHFHLDTEALEDLTFELIKGQRLAVDEHGEVLVWTGEPLAAKRGTQRGAAAEIRFHTLPKNRRLDGDRFKSVPRRFRYFRASPKAM